MLPVAPGVVRARILWADDNADMRDYLHRLLADRYDVLAAADGLTALSKALGEPPECHGESPYDASPNAYLGVGKNESIKATELQDWVQIWLKNAKAVRWHRHGCRAN